MFSAPANADSFETASTRNFLPSFGPWIAEAGFHPEEARESDFAAQNQLLYLVLVFHPVLI